MEAGSSSVLRECKPLKPHMHSAHSPQPLWNLPPPSQLRLQDSSPFANTNTLPPINHQPLHHQLPLHQWSAQSVKYEAMQSPSKDAQPGLPGPAADDPMPSTSDFVKKLYKMLEDQSFQHVVSWGPQGDCFIVKDMNDFTKSILPRMFKHSNFASFVRQLNKYDFHKVKNTDDNQFGEHTWTFRHPDFNANRKDALENIKRKVPAARKSNTPSSSSTTTRPLSPTNYSPHHLHHHPYQSQSPVCIQTQAHVESLQNEIRWLREEGEDMRTRIRTLERNYENVLLEFVGFQRSMAQQDGIMQNLIAYFTNNDSGEFCSSSTLNTGNAGVGVSARFAGSLLTAASAANGDHATSSLSGFGVAGANSVSSGFSTFSALGVIGRGVFSQS
ncbi:hypothetical protein AX15_000827 [Amanita polypyramis BW_CC]|nr:hypothetical protein AX15_000827 [Amanita polypyramis BW_CC]